MGVGQRNCWLVGWGLGKGNEYRNMWIIKCNKLIVGDGNESASQNRRRKWFVDFLVLRISSIELDGLATELTLS